MQYLYDDTVQPLRFFTKIVMRCVNDALDYATAPQRHIREITKTCDIRLANEAPPQIQVPVEVLSTFALPKLIVPVEYPSPPNSPAGVSTKISAVFANSGALVFGYIDGHVTLAGGYLTCVEGDPNSSSVERGQFESTEVVALDPGGGPVVALDAVIVSNMEWAVTVGYRRSVFVLLVTLKRGECYSISRRRRYQQQVVEIPCESFPMLETVSSLKLSHNAAHISVCYNNDSRVTIISVPPLKIPRDTDSEEVSRVVLGASARVAYAEGAFGGGGVRIFYIPDLSRQGVSFGVKTQSLGTFSNCASANNLRNSTTGSFAMPPASGDSSFSRHCILGLLLWVGSTAFSRCPLRPSRSGTEGKPAVLAAVDAIGTESNVERLAASASKSKGTPRTSERHTRRGRSRASSTVNIPGDHLSLPSSHKNLLPSVIVAAEVAAGDRSLVAVVCENSCVYFMDARGIASVCNIGSPSYCQSPCELGVTPYISDGGHGHVPSVTVALKTKGCTTLAHVRGPHLENLMNCATANSIHEVAGLRVTVPLGDLPLLLLICEDATYLWDVHYNRVVAKIDDLPPLQQVVTYELRPTSQTSGLYQGLTKQQQLQRQQQQQQQQQKPPYQEQEKEEVFCAVFTDNAVWWPTTNGSVACLTVNGLLRSLYPTLIKYFPQMTPYALAQVLERLAPRYRQNEEHIAALELPAEAPCHMGAGNVLSNTLSSGMVFPLAARFRSIQLSNSALGLEAAATQFLEGACNSSAQSKEEVARLMNAAH
ncbi:hypothetical protein, conserved [Trypanosoma brucei gambiense DAL972]|uniref:Uncharacterized protein n=1 Tax=Trypanosoma brucei gambiense (strain MHOM/CI/86/DAL972) TaxID=679716 RepID=C9ZQI3_TRYB9|nr:hypothetical protein, conserved [Trypanosoma brucei gambiense DAL972]CBH11663.1 hypothetical protein, conserved [Trypanosoma brucei gambiense DAL972]|eukprot:XP_011773948.1 hypothetical protein, conserved [Trypanosoma brucei gambiense DAL972]